MPSRITAGYPPSTADAIAKSFENFEIDEIDQMISGAIPVSGSAKAAIKYTEKYPELFEYVRKLNGLPKSFGLHACGKIISTRELDYFLPSCYDDDGVRFLQGDMHTVEDVGLVKIDLLGLRTLDQEYDTLEMSNQDMAFLDPRQRYTDPKVLDIFRNGDKVRLAPFSFRDDHRKCSVKDGRILYAIPLIRDCNAACADVVYQFRDSAEPYFWMLAKQMVEAGLDKSKIRILIQLNFFSEYGNSKQLLRVFDFLELFKFGARSKIKKDKLDSSDFLYEVIQKYSSDRNAKGVELKQFTILDIDGILNSIEDHMKRCDIQDFSAKMQAAYQNEYLGFVFLATGREEDRPKLFVKEVYPVCRKSDNRQFGYSIITQSLGSGKESRFTVFNRVFDKDPIQKNDLILCKHYAKDGPYFQLDSYTHIY